MFRGNLVLWAVLLLAIFSAPPVSLGGDDVKTTICPAWDRKEAFPSKDKFYDFVRGEVTSCMAEDGKVGYEISQIKGKPFVSVVLRPVITVLELSGAGLCAIYGLEKDDRLTWGAAAALSIGTGEIIKKQLSDKTYSLKFECSTLELLKKMEVVNIPKKEITGLKKILEQ